MIFTKAAALVALMMMTGSVQAADATATLTINVTFTRPTCNITVPPSYDLQTLKEGEKEHPALKITWSCEGNTPLKTALTAAIVKGKLKGNEKVTLLTDDGQPSGVTLSLKGEAGRLIKLTGAGGGGFCVDEKEATGMRTCTLTPVTEVSRQAGTGQVSAILRFEVGYQ